MLKIWFGMYREGKHSFQANSSKTHGYYLYQHQKKKKSPLSMVAHSLFSIAYSQSCSKKGDSSGRRRASHECFGILWGQIGMYTERNKISPFQLQSVVYFEVFSYRQ